MPTKLCVWGNSLGVRLPKHVAQCANLQAGDYLFVRLTDAGDIVMRPVKPRDVHPGYAIPAVNQATPAQTQEPEKW